MLRQACWLNISLAYRDVKTDRFKKKKKRKQQNAVVEMKFKNWVYRQ